MTAVYEWIRNLTAFFLFLSVMENLLPGQKYGKYIRLFAGMVLILLAVEPFTSGLNLDEVLARSYEDLVIRGEAGELKEQLGATEQKRLGQILSQYEEAVGQDVQGACAVLRPGFVMDCRVHIEGDEDSPEFGTVREIAAVLPAQSAQAEKEKLSNRIQEYYGLEEQYVEIEIAGGEGPVDLSPDSGRDSLYSGISGGQ
ncbi:MAG: stage III sporulation protein AF [Clostridium sp.]